MARVVQRRSNPPYLLILFVFLTLIAATLAVIFNSNASDSQKRLDQANKEIKALYPANANVGDDFAALRADAMKGGLSFATRVNTEIVDKLVQALANKPVSASKALAEAEGARAQFAEDDRNKGFVDLADQMNNRIADREKQIATLSAAVAKLQDDKTQIQGQLDTQAAQFTTDLADTVAKLTRKQQDFDAQENAYQDDLKKANDEWQAKVDVVSAQNTKLTTQTRRLQGDVEIWNATVAKLKAELIDRRPPGPGIKPALVAKGEILEIDREDNLLFINIGKNQGVEQGQPFAVYGRQEGIGEDGQGKADIVVTNPQETISECRLSRSTLSNPVLKGDVIGNLAFSAHRKNVFVVEGDFDINGDGRIDARGAEVIRDMITRSGGVVTDKVDVNVDFVVVGENPTHPPRPSDTAPDIEKQQYADLIKSIQQFEDVKAEAAKWQIPALNTNRFLSFIGYAPEMGD